MGEVSDPGKRSAAKGESSKVSKIFVLGDTGFIGRHLVEFFRGTFPAIPVVGFSRARCDLTDREATAQLRDYLNGQTVLIHCAAI